MGSKTSSRIYFIVLSVIFFVLFLVSVIALGAFGVIQKRVADFEWELPGNSKCILFGQKYGTRMRNGEEVPIIQLSGLAVCAYVLWGQVSILIVAFIWMSYSAVMLAFGLRVLSPLRLLDVVVMFLTFVLSLALSITLSAGIRTTCNVNNSRSHCSSTHLLSIHDDSDASVSFYGPLHIAEVGSWITALILFGLTIWNLILIVMYSKYVRKHKEEGETHGPPSGDVSPADSIEELANVAASSRTRLL